MDEQLERDFPIDWEEDHYVTRREFFKFVTLASGGLAVGSVALAAWSKTRGAIQFEAVRIASTSDIPVGAWMQFFYPRSEDPCVLIQREAGKFLAFSRRCTHLSCPVEVQLDLARLYCPCHNGAFSLDDGRVLQGPPPRKLPQIILEVRGSDIYAKGVKL